MGAMGLRHWDAGGGVVPENRGGEVTHTIPAGLLRSVRASEGLGQAGRGDTLWGEASFGSVVTLPFYCTPTALSPPCLHPMKCSVTRSTVRLSPHTTPLEGRILADESS